MKKFFLTVFFILGIFLISSIILFKKDDILESAIIKFYENNCGHSQEYCLMDLSEIIVDWDNIYIFNKGTDNSEINKIINDKYIAEEPISYKFIVIKDKKIKDVFEIFIQPFENNKSYLEFSYENILKNNNMLEDENFRFYKINKFNSVVALKKSEVLLDENLKYDIYIVYPLNKDQIK